jgi:phosphoglycerate dehydrogenase-like enzyme
MLKALDMTVLGVRGNPAAGRDAADEVHGLEALPALLARADFVVLVCPLTPETEGLIGNEALSAMKPTAHLVNCARGRVVDEAALIAALDARKIAGAALDVMVEEPLPESSPLWAMPNVFLTPHTAGETRAYEDNVLDLMMENLARLRTGKSDLVNGIV